MTIRETLFLGPEEKLVQQEGWVYCVFCNSETQPLSPICPEIGEMHKVLKNGTNTSLEAARAVAKKHDKKHPDHDIVIEAARQTKDDAVGQAIGRMAMW